MKIITSHDPQKRFQSKNAWDIFFIKTNAIRNRMSPTEQKDLPSIIEEELKKIRRSK